MSIKSSIFPFYRSCNLNQSNHTLVCSIYQHYCRQIKINLVISRTYSWIINFLIWLVKFMPTNPKGQICKKLILSPDKVVFLVVRTQRRHIVKLTRTASLYSTAICALCWFILTICCCILADCPSRSGEDFCTASKVFCLVSNWFSSVLLLCVFD